MTELRLQLTDHQPNITLNGRVVEKLNRLVPILFSRLFDAAPTGCLHLKLPCGSIYSFGEGGSGPEGELTLVRPRGFWRMLRGGAMGFAESYVDGDWYSPDLHTMFKFVLASGAFESGGLDGGKVGRAIARVWHLMRRNTRSGSRANIAYHYDLGNDFYKLWLDPSMTYSSACFTSGNQSLEEAQAEKYERILTALDPKPGARILEVGCGWGGFAEHAVNSRDLHVDAITISKEQHRFATDRLLASQHGNRADIQLTDYRDVEGVYDHIVSIEMFEAVGESHWPTYFQMLRDRLKPGGTAVLQIITIADELFDAYRRKTDFIQRYIFPGGMLPSERALRREVNSAGLELSNVDYFAADYARTLLEWRTRFHTEWLSATEQGFDQKFRRLWDYYLCYCAAGFEHESIDVGQFLIYRPD